MTDHFSEKSTDFWDTRDNQEHDMNFKLTGMKYYGLLRVVQDAYNCSENYD